MGGCNSTGSQAAHSLGQSCGRRFRNGRQQRARNNSSSSSTASSTGDTEPSGNASKVSGLARPDNNRANPGEQTNIRSIPIKLSGELVASETAVKTTATTDSNQESENNRETKANNNKTTNKGLDQRQPERRSSKPELPSAGRKKSTSSSTSSTSSSSSSSGPALASSQPNDHSATNAPETHENSRTAKLAKLKEGVDFIENEGDVEAVESAVVKIQSTFRGKKIRSKLSGKQTPADPAATKGALSENKNNSNLICSSQTSQSASTQQEDSLSKKLATMQVNDKTPTPTASSTSNSAGEKQATSPTTNLPEDVAATKIQAGFKGYKIRKELAEEGKLVGGSQSQPEQHEAGK